MENHDFTPKNHIFSNFRGARAECDPWLGDYNIQRTDLCRITTCNERRINRVHLKSSLYTNCQIVRAERNSILQPLLICIYIAFM
jgi:hypothetical protein